MRIAVRIDASRQIGIGHFMRCLTLADALKQRGVELRFVSRYLPTHLRDMLEARNYEFIILNSKANNNITGDLPHAHWLGISQDADAQDTIQALSGQAWDWLVVDHYALDARWESVLRQAVRHVLVIDDLADRQHDCDILLDQNYYVNMLTRYDRLTSKACRMLLGPNFALLRDEFIMARTKIRKRDGKIRRILVFFGGGDLGNETLKALQALQKINCSELAIDVIIGQQNSYRNDLEIFAASLENVTTHFNVSNMSDLVAAADLYVGAAGTTTWERCCLGLPSLVITVAANQVKATRDLDCSGVLTYLGESCSVTAEQITFAIAECISSPSRMIKQSEKGLALVDGRGVSLCVESIIQCTKADAGKEKS